MAEPAHRADAVTRLAGWFAALALILSMSVLPAAAYEPSCDCKIAAGDTLWMAGLVSGQRYVAWWSVATTEDGPYYYAAAQNAARAVADGRIPVFLFPDSEPGWHEVYAEKAVWDAELGRYRNPSYDASQAVAECEFWLGAP